MEKREITSDDKPIVLMFFIICYKYVKLNIVKMKLRKGKKLIFKDRIETIIKASNDPVNGMVKTDKQEYSIVFINRWLQFGFVKVE